MNRRHLYADEDKVRRGVLKSGTVQTTTEMRQA